MIKVHPIEIFEDNYIWLIINSDQNKVIAVDPGEADALLDFLQRNSLDLEAILVTHHHFDHTQGIHKLTQQFNVDVYGSNLEIEGVNKIVNEGDVISFSDGSVSFKVLSTPGHTLDHVTYVAPGMLFCGDTLFAAGCGRLFEGTPKQLYDSLQKLIQFPEDTKAYCTHEYTLNNLKFAQLVEPKNQDIHSRLKRVAMLREQQLCTLPTLLKEEKLTNPFLRCEVKDVIHSVEQYAGLRLEDPVLVFQYLRQWKDSWR